MDYNSEVPPPPPPRAPINHNAPAPKKIVRFDKSYVQSVPGILKLGQLVRLLFYYLIDFHVSKKLNYARHSFFFSISSAIERQCVS